MTVSARSALLLGLSAIVASHCGTTQKEVVPQALVVLTPAPRPWPEVLAPQDLPAWRFVDGGAPSRGVRGPALGAVTVTAVTPGEVHQEGPVAWLETKVTLKGRPGAPSTGELEIALPRATLAGVSTDAKDAAPRPLREFAGPTREGARTFRTAPITLAAGETRELVVAHALVLGDREALALHPLDPSAPATTTAPLTGTSAGRLKLETDRPTPASAPLGAAAAPGAIVLCDTSAARARDLASELSLIREVAARLGSGRLVVAAYDESVTSLYDGPADQITSAVGESLVAREALGGSDTPLALRFAFGLEGADLPQVILVTDGLDARPFGTVALANPKARSLTLAVPSAGADLRALESLVGGVSRNAQAISLEEGATAVAEAALAGARPAPKATPVVWPFRTNGALAARGRVLVSTSSAGESALPEFVLAATREPATKPRAATSLAALSEGARPLPSADDVRTIVDPMAGLDASNHTAKPVAIAPDGAKPPVAPEPKLPPKEELPTVETEGDDGPAQLPPETIQWIVRKNFGRFRGCYREALRRNPKAGGRVVIRFDIDESGAVPLARAVKANVGDTDLVACVVRSFEALSFPPLPNASAVVEYPLVLAAKDGAAEPAPMPAQRPNKLTPELDPASVAMEPWQTFVKDVHDASDRGDHATAVSKARAAIEADPTAPDGFILLGDAHRRSGDTGRALRAYTSVLESHPDLELMVALRLLSLDLPAAKKLAVELATLAAADPAANPEALRIVAFTAATAGDVDAARKAIDVALGRPVDPAKYPGVRDLLRSDLAMLTAASMAKRPADRVQLKAWAAGVGVVPTERAVTAVSATWDGSADMDLTIRDIGFNAANKSTPVMPSGGRILADVARGAGPEAFVVETPASHPYWIGLKAKLDRAYGFGAVLVVQHDGEATFKLSAHPFDLNVDGGSVDVMRLEEPICAKTPCVGDGAKASK